MQNDLIKVNAYAGHFILQSKMILALKYFETCLKSRVDLKFSSDFTSKKGSSLSISLASTITFASWCHGSWHWPLKHSNGSNGYASTLKSSFVSKIFLSYSKHHVRRGKSMHYSKDQRSSSPLGVQRGGDLSRVCRHADGFRWPWMRRRNRRNRLHMRLRLHQRVFLQGQWLQWLHWRVFLLDRTSRFCYNHGYESVFFFCSSTGVSSSSSSSTRVSSSSRYQCWSTAAACQSSCRPPVFSIPSAPLNFCYLSGEDHSGAAGIALPAETWESLAFHKRKKSKKNSHEKNQTKQIFASNFFNAEDASRRKIIKDWNSYPKKLPCFHEWTADFEHLPDWTADMS